jgi:DegV family protein with EDD domain
MADYVLSCCSTADLSKEYFERRKIPWLPFHFNMDGRDYPDDLGQTMPLDEFYARIAAGALPTTSQVNVGEFVSFFEPFLQQGRDILHISLSSGISGTYNSALLARDQLLLKYPGRKLLIVDSLGASSGYGLLEDQAADRKEAGQSIEDVHAWAEANKLNVHHWFFTTDLTHLKRGGRISAASAMLGGLLNICPLMNMDQVGKLVPREKIRTKKHVMAAMVEKMEEHAQGGTAYAGKAFMCNSACYQDARMVADMVEAKFPNLDGRVMINTIGTAIGSHTGPGTVALFFMGDPRTD